MLVVLTPVALTWAGSASRKRCPPDALKAGNVAVGPADKNEAELAACDRKLAQYRAALDAGADPASIARWITETEAERARLRIATRQAVPQQTMSKDEIAAIVNGLADLLTVLRDADQADKAEIYAQLGLRLTYQPADLIVRTEVNVIRAGQHWSFERVRGGT